MEKGDCVPSIEGLGFGYIGLKEETFKICLFESCEFRGGNGAVEK
jgi:hypothetical protein